MGENSSAVIVHRHQDKIFRAQRGGKLISYQPVFHWPGARMSKLEKQWWFVGPVSFVTAVTTISLLMSAGIWPIAGAAQWLVSMICTFFTYRVLSVVGRAVAIFAFPKSTLLD